MGGHERDDASSARIDHPLRRILADDAVHAGWFRARVRAPAPSLAAACRDPDVLGAAVHDEAGRSAPGMERIAASFLLGRAAWRVLGPLCVSYLADRRLPRVDADSLGCALSVDKGTEAAVSIASSRFVALRGDPAAAHPDATVVGDLGVLRSLFRCTAISLLGPLVQGLRPWVRRSERTRWGTASDALVLALRLAGDRCGVPERGLTEAAAVLELGAPLWGEVKLRHLEDGDSSRTATVRNTCCLAYQLAAGRFCAGCPLAGAAAVDPPAIR